LADWLLASGDVDAALSLITATIDRAEQGEGLASLISALHRLRGQAFAALGDTTEARSAFEEAISVARSAEKDFLMRSTDFEVGQAYAALASLAGAMGEDPAAYVAERDAILRPLGVVS
jgi:tetratricopeptide (TPR) repeat protein